MFCPNCGNKIDYGERFCSKCGVSTEESVNIKKGISPMAMKLILLGAVVLIAVVVLAVVFSGVDFNSSPKAVINSFFVEVQKSNPRGASVFIDPYLFEEYGSGYVLGQIEQFSEAIKSRTLIGYSIEEVEKLGEEMATVGTRISVENWGSNELVSIYLVKREGKWYIGDLNFWLDYFTY